MGYSEFINNVNKSDLQSQEWVGKVEDNNDPEFAGRCKVRIYGKFDGTIDDTKLDSTDFIIPTEDLPWAYPGSGIIFGGGESHGAGNLSVPKVGAKVKVKFSGGNLYAPEYFALQDLNQSVIDEVKASYQNAHVLFLDEDEKVKVVYTPAKGL